MTDTKAALASLGWRVDTPARLAEAAIALRNQLFTHNDLDRRKN